MRENGSAVIIATHHSITSVDVAGIRQLIELHCQDICISLTSTTTSSILMTVYEVESRKDMNRS